MIVEPHLGIKMTKEELIIEKMEQYPKLQKLSTFVRNDPTEQNKAALLAGQEYLRKIELQIEELTA
jgi:hypothetical protein